MGRLIYLEKVPTMVFIVWSSWFWGYNEEFTQSNNSYEDTVEMLANGPRWSFDSLYGVQVY